MNLPVDVTPVESKRSIVQLHWGESLTSGENPNSNVLAKIGITPADELQQFLPDVWKREDANEPTEK